MLNDETVEDRRQLRGPNPALLGVALLAGALVGGIAGGGAGYLAASRAAENEPLAAATATAIPSATTPVRVEVSSAVSDAIAKVIPAMVVLEVQGPERRDSLGRLVQTTSAGSGVIIDTRGYLVT